MFGWLCRSVPKTVCLTVNETEAIRKDNQGSVFLDSAKTVFCVTIKIGGR